MNSNIRDYLGKQVLFFDGGTGSVLQARGLKPGELPENWNIEKPEEIVQLNYSYYLAGSNIVNTNTFGAFETKFSGNGKTYSLDDIISSAFKNANEARKLIKEKDPAVNSIFEALLYPSLKVQIYYKISHYLYLKKQE